MAKGDQKILNSPFQVWVIKVDQYNRVRVPLHEVRSHLPWLPDKNTQFDCVAMPGPSGGIELVAAAAHQIVVAQFTAAIHGAQRPIPGGKWLEVARLMATAWLLSFTPSVSQRERKRMAAR